jgi:hypothetical protein
MTGFLEGKHVRFVYIKDGQIAFILETPSEPGAHSTYAYDCDFHDLASG